jgi:hypothetical protein
MKKIKQTIVTAVLKYYPPVVLFFAIGFGLFFLGVIFAMIENYFVPNVPVHLR